MNRVYLSLIITAAIIAVNICSHLLIIHEEKNISQTLTMIQQYMDGEQKEEALTQTDELTGQWDKSRKRLAFFVSDRNLDEISDSIAKIKPLIDSDSDEVNAEAEYVKRKLRRTHIKDLPYIHNIF